MHISLQCQPTWGCIQHGKEICDALAHSAGFTDNSSVSVIPTPDQKELYTMTESVAGTYRADLGTLSTLGPVKFNDGVKGLLTTAYPTLMEDGTLVNLINGVGSCHHHCQ